MDYGNDLYNPLSYDDKILSEQLSFTYSNPAQNFNATQVQPPPNTINRELYTQLLERDSIVNQVKKEMQAEFQRTPRKTVPSQRNNSARTDNYQEGFSTNKRAGDLFDDPRFLLFLVIVLSAICFLQWITYSKQIETMNGLMSAMTTKRPQTVAEQPQTITEKLISGTPLN